MAATCRKCGTEFAITEAAKRKGMYTCASCRAARSKADYERRKALGLKVSGTKMPPEYHRARQAIYSKLPHVKARRAVSRGAPLMRPDLPLRVQKAAEAFDRIAAMDSRMQMTAAALALSIYGPLFEEVREALKEFADA